jgi:hypothetical protein
MNELIYAWAVTATLAALWYAYQFSAAKDRALWTIKMLVNLYAGKVQVARDGNKLLFSYENENERNVIGVEIK